MARIVFLTCHLSGSGHLVRTLTLAGTARDRGHDVAVLNGGRPLLHLSSDGSVVQLPPVTIRGLEFGVLRRSGGAPVDASYMAARRATIAAALADDPPDALVTELYPFGRRVLADEFDFAIAEAHALNPRAAILCSVRDIPEPKPHRIAGIAARLRAGFDGVLIHGDPDILPLSAHWPMPDDLSSRLCHVGYLGRSMPSGERGQDVLVSCGGGVLGRRLAGIAAQSARLSARRWRVLIGGADADQIVADLMTCAPENLKVEPARPDFPDLLAGAACSVSLCGYNTAVELAQTPTPAILVPSTEGGEQEQTLRARAFAQLPGFVMLDGDSLSPGDLAAQADRLAGGPARQPAPLLIDQGQRALAALETILRRRRP